MQTSTHTLTGRRPAAGGAGGTRLTNAPKSYPPELYNSPAPSAQRPAPSAQRPAPSAQRPAPSGMTCARRPAGARKPASRTSAGSRRPDAHAGRSCARPSLFSPLALLLGALSLFAAAPVAAQKSSNNEQTLLTATLTVDQAGTLVGCGATSIATCSAALTTTSFTHEGTANTITEISGNTLVGTLDFKLGTGIAAASWRRLTLHLDGESHPLAGERPVGTTQRTYLNYPPSTWTDGQRVKVRLTARPWTGVEFESASFVTSSETGQYDLIVPENGSATFGVKLTTPPTANVTVDLATAVAEQFHADANAVTFSPTTLTFTSSNYSDAQTVTVTGVPDDDGDHEHLIVLALVSSTDSDYGSADASEGVFVTVTDDGGAVQVGVQPASAREDDFNPIKTHSITFWLSRASSSAVTVGYRHEAGTATFVLDYSVTTAGTVTFAPGETRKTVNFDIVDDDDEDSGETFYFVLSNPSGATIAPGYGRARVTILNDETGEFTVTLADNSGGGAPANNNNGGNAGPGGSGFGDDGSSAPSSRAALSDLVVTPRDEDGNQGKRLSLSPAFTPSTTAYTLDVPYTTETLDIMPGLTSGTAAVGTRGAGAASPFPAAPSYPVSLPPGETTVIEITVTAEDGSRTRPYTLSATRAAPNTDPSLPALVVNGNDKSRINLSPAFSPDNTDYEASLAYAVNAVTFTPTTRNTGARVRIGGREVPGGQASAPVPLAVGSNEITLTVTAEDGLATRAYTLTLARAGADAEPPAADPRALPDLSRALADDTQHSIATRLATARTPAPGRTAPLSARLTQALAAVLPGQAAGAAAPAPAFDPVLAEARVDSGWAAPAAPVNWQALLDNAGAALALGAAPDAGESPTGLASLSLWSDGAYRRVGGHNDGLDWSGDLMGARIGLDMRLTPSLTGGAALGWQRAGWTGNAGAGATRHTLSLLGLNPYAGWQRGRLSAWVSGGLGKGTLNSRQRGEEDNGTAALAGDEARPQLPGNHGADGYSEDGYNGDTHSEDVTTHTLGGGLGGRLFDTDALSLGLKAEALATSLATETHRARTHRLRLALDATHVRRLSNDAVLTPALELGLRHDGGAGPGGLGLEAGGALRYAGGPLTLRGQARALVGRGGYREWGLSGTAEWRARTDGRGLMLRLAPGLGSAQSGIGQLWAQGLRDKTHGAPQQAARLDASLSYAWDAPGHRGRITPYLALHRQQAAAAYRLGARWDAPSGFSLRLAGERNAGYAGAPADHALLLEGSWRPGR